MVLRFSFFYQKRGRTEEGSQDVDSEYCAYELPGRPDEALRLVLGESRSKRFSKAGAEGRMGKRRT